MNFIVGTFNSPEIYVLQYELGDGIEQASLSIVSKQAAIGGQNWLSLSKPRPDSKIRYMYASAWTEPPSIAAYSVDTETLQIKLINSKTVRATPGYTCCSDTHVYAVGGPSGEAFKIADDGAIGELIQELDFGATAAYGEVPHGDFGGLRHGSHSVDLSPDGRSLYVADIGRNAIFTYSVNSTSVNEPHLKLGTKEIAPRSNDGPRHAWPHPNGKILYSLQEHSSMVDLYSIDTDGTTLKHLTGVKIIPADKDPKDYWADEVRLSLTNGSAPRYLFASTRGLHKDTMGYVAVYDLHPDGTLASDTAICIWKTPTSGGIANAIEPAPTSSADIMAMTDSQEGWVFVLQFDGKTVTETARIKLGETSAGKIVQPATAVWL